MPGVGEVAERVIRLEGIGLIAHRFDDLDAAVSHLAVPEAGGGVEVLLAGVVPYEDAFAAADHQPAPSTAAMLAKGCHREVMRRQVTTPAGDERVSGRLLLRGLEDQR